MNSVDFKEFWLQRIQIIFTRQNFAWQIRGARRFFLPEKKVFLVGFSLIFPRFLRKSKNQLNASLPNFFEALKQLIIRLRSLNNNDIIVSEQQCYDWISYGKYTSILQKFSETNILSKTFCNLNIANLSKNLFISQKKDWQVTEHRFEISIR